MEILVITRLLAISFFIFLPEAVSAETQREAIAAPDCLSVDDCIAILIDYEIKPPPAPNVYRSSGIDPRPIENAVHRLVSFGDPAVVALIHLLDHPNFNVQNRAAYTLFHFHEIDPRHLSALIAAHKSGLHWLEPAIAATKTDKALAYLWQDFLDDPDAGSNSQTIRMLPTFGNRLLPYLQDALRNCPNQIDWNFCTNVMRMAWQFEPRPDFVVPAIEEIAKSSHTSEEIRRAALSYMFQLRHPYGLDVIERDLRNELAFLRKYPTTGVVFDYQQIQPEGLAETLRNIEDTLDSAAMYGEEAQKLGQLVVEMLSRSDLPDIRAAAALTVGLIGYRDGAKVLQSMRSDFDDDWYFGYNAAESLGRMQIEAARPFLQELAEHHWYKPVRNNAERALASLAGYGFTRPDVPGDVEPIPDMPYFSMSNRQVRYAGDVLAIAHACSARYSIRYRRYRSDQVTWPGSGIQDLELQGPLSGQARRFFDNHPNLQKYADVPGRLTFAVEFGDWQIAGLDAGEFGGGVYAISGSGEVRLLFPANPIAAFKINDALVVTEGLSHLGVSSGEVWIIRLANGVPKPERRIPLQSSPDGHALAFRETLIVRDSLGDVAIRSDGRLVDPVKIEACEAQPQ